MSKDLTEALRKLMEGDTNTNVVAALKARGAAPIVRSAALLAGGGGAGSGLASPLTEQSFAAREYHAAGWTTTDGLFTMPAISKVTFADLNGAIIELVFKPPT